jgi:predicted ATPase/DNA-binding SARP family transcriptional activator
MEFRVLGPLEVLADDGAPVRIGGKRPRALLALLLLHANQPVSTDRLIDGIWGESPPASAAGALQVHVSALRKAIGAERIVTRSPGYLVRVAEGELDADRFEQLVAAGDAHGALALWRGPALADMAHEEFAQADAGRLEEARIAAIEARIAADLADGRHATLVGELDALVATHPHRERFQEQRILALYRSSRQQDALAAYRAARQALDDLGLEPSPDLRALERRILEHDPTLHAASPAPAGSRVTDTALIGRELELASVTALLQRADVRLVTLTGVGGVGKTSLAHEATARLGRGVFVDLAPLVDPDLMLLALAQELGVEQTSDRPLLGEVSQALADTALVVLDNLEHLPGAFPTVAALLESTPRLKILATSRVPLHLRAEHEYRVPLLPTPQPGIDDATGIEEIASVRLYVERARDAVTDFELTDANSAGVARICRALDGLPLAVELAAARIRVLGVDGTAQRLGESLALLTRTAPDLPHRQRSLRATIDWSVELLDEAAEHVFCALGSFAGTASLDAVEHVADRGTDVLAALESLLDSGLVAHHTDAAGGPRFGMLETIREYAVERLEVAGRLAEMRDRHAAYFVEALTRVNLARREDPEVYSVPVLAPDRDNFRAALDHLAASSDDEGLVLLTHGLLELWRRTGAIDEGIQRFELAVERASSLDGLHRAFALHGLGVLVYVRGELERAAAALDEAIRLYESEDDPVQLGRAFVMRAATANGLGDSVQARELQERAIPVLREAGDRIGVARALLGLATSSARDGDEEAAERHLEEAHDLFRATASREFEGFTSMVLASKAAARGAFGIASERLSRALSIATELDDFETIAGAFVVAAELACESDRPQDAARLLGAAEATFGRFGETRWEMEREQWGPTLDEISRALSPEELGELRRAGASQPVEDSLGAAFAVTDRLLQ